MALERFQFLSQTHQRSGTAIENVSICRAQCSNEAGGGVAALIDEMHERVQIVEEKVWIDLATEALELHLQTRVLQSRAAHAIAFPILEQEHGLIDMGNGDDERDDREEGRCQRILTRADVTREFAPPPQSCRRERDGEDGDEGEKHSQPLPRPQQPVLATRQPEVECSIPFPNQERHRREPDVRCNQPGGRVLRMIDQPRQVHDERSEDRAHE